MADQTNAPPPKKQKHGKELLTPAEVLAKLTQNKRPWDSRYDTVKANMAVEPEAEDE